MLPKVTTDPVRHIKVHLKIHLKFKMQEDTEMTFLGLHGAEIRVKFFDNVRSVFYGLFCHVTLPLPEAKLEKIINIY